MRRSAYYPPTPVGVPPDLTLASGKYRFQVLLVALSLLLFFAVYLGMILGTAYLAYWFAVVPLGKHDNWNPLVNGGGAFACGMLFLFLVKGLFKSQRLDLSHYLELHEEDQPELFAFIHQLCGEVNAPLPSKVYVSPDVNAAVISNRSLLNLVISPRKYLLIGLGLVNMVNLREFKAVLAHEFGHFAQRSLALGRYVYVVRLVLSDLIFARDSWDDWLWWWARIDIRISFPAWGLLGIIWLLRKILGLVFKGINLLDLSLSRQMEFNADDTAVSAAGSDAIVHVLARLEFASEALSAAAHGLFPAADHGLFTRDIFFHQTDSAAWLRTIRKDPQLGIPPTWPERGATDSARVFDPARGDEGIPAMWRTHPPNHEREANAKRHYLWAPQDECPAWLLFTNADALKQEISGRFYRFEMARKEIYEPRDAAEVQAFIDAERAEVSYDPKYHGLYDDRFINPGLIGTAIADANVQPLPAEKLLEFLRNWPRPELEQEMATHRERCQEQQLLSGLQCGDLVLKGKTFKFRDQDVTAREVPRCAKIVEQELNADTARMNEEDARVFAVHYQVARELDGGPSVPGTRQHEMEERYRFHLAVQDLLRSLMMDDQRVRGLLNAHSGQRELSTADFQTFVGALNSVSQSLWKCVDDAKNLSTPALTNVPAGTPLDSLIWEKAADLPQPLGNATQIQIAWVIDYMQKQNAAQERLRRVHFKSLGKILALQERIAEEWLKPHQPAEPPISPTNCGLE